MPRTKTQEMTMEMFATSSKKPTPSAQPIAANKVVYPHGQVLAKALEYFQGDELAANVWINKYALKDSQGNLYERDPDDMHRRIASELARIEQQYPNPLTEDQIFDTLQGFEYLVPQGGSMAGIGNPHQVASLSNCFVIGNRGNSDSYGGIMKVDEEQVQLMKRRGGVGHDLSHIRPKGSPVMNSALTATGVVPFMERYSNSTREVAQEGRRGALMLSISIKHPDVEDFIDAKTDRTKITGANISIRIDDEFMKAVDTGDKYNLRFPTEGPEAQTVTINARSLWQKLIHNAWDSGEPGILFWDTILRESIPDCYADFGFTTKSTNPCGEVPLCPYDSCRLLAINLFSFVERPFTNEATFNFDKLRQYSGYAQRLMDDIVDLELEKIDKILDKIDADPEPHDVKSTEYRLWKKIKSKCIEGRRTGLGITAEGDMLAALGLRYASKEAIQFSEKVHQTLALSAYAASVEMAKERGAFPVYDSRRESQNPFIHRVKKAEPALYEEMQKYGRRNIAMLTIAPTGTASIMTQTTSGIEPVFRVYYNRKTKVVDQDPNARVDSVDENGDKWQDHHVFHHQFLTWLATQGISTSEAELLPEEKLNELIAASPYHEATANDVAWLSKVEMQGTIQKWVDHSISVTVNLPNEVTESLIGEIFMKAWKSGCKGITVYRDGSRSGVLESASKKKPDESQFLETKPPKRPVSLEAKIIRFRNNHEKWIAVIGLYNDRPYEIFTGRAEDSLAILESVDQGWILKSKGPNGENRYDFQYEDRDGYKVTIEGLSRSFDPEYWNYAKLISGIMRHGMPITFIVDMVSNLNLRSESLNTWKHGVTRALKQFIPNGTVPADNTCPECQDKALIFEEGCLSCKSCGFTKCE